MGLVLEASKREVRAIDSLMDELARVLPDLRDGDGYQSLFIEDPPGYVVDHDEERGCPFLFTTKTHSLCAIHAVALDSGRPVASVKPAGCRHWPVTLEPRGDVVRVTVQPAARRFGCVGPVGTNPGKPTVLEAFRDEITELCGPGLIAKAFSARKRTP